MCRPKMCEMAILCRGLFGVFFFVALSTNVTTAVGASRGAGGAWVQVSSLPTPRRGHSAAVVNGGIYVIGGIAASGRTGVVERYIPATNTWATLAAMPTARDSFAVAVVGPNIYAIGGQTGQHTDVVEIYDTSTNTWTTGLPLPQPRLAMGAEVIDGIVYVVGGQNLIVNGSGSQTRKTNGVDALLGVCAETWEPRAPMPTVRDGLSTVLFDDTVYAVGGSFNGALDAVESYSHVTDSWTILASLKVPRLELGVTAYNRGSLIAIGGLGRVEPALDAVEGYDPVLDEWIALPSLPHALSEPAAVTVDGVVYVIGGQGADSAIRSEVWMYVPCGNAVVEFGEECDDGNTADGDDCTAECESPRVCGDHNEDNRVTTTDALLVLKRAVGQEGPLVCPIGSRP